VLPKRNEPDLAELPAEVRNDMQFVPVENLEQALAVALPMPVPAT
jgi:ATP-dependent Lon protease